MAFKRVNEIPISESNPLGGGVIEVVENPVDIEATNLVMLAVAELHGIVLSQQAEIETLKAIKSEGGTT